MVRYFFDTGGGIGYVTMLFLNHEGEPMDITQARVCSRVCTFSVTFMPVNILISVNSLEAERESENIMKE